MSDTIVALSSGRPPAAIAVTRLSGPAAWAAIGSLAGPLPAPRVAALRTLRDPVSREAIDRGLVILFPEGASATGEAIAEFHGHGGRAVSEAVIAAFAGFPGVRRAEAGEFTRRALSNGVMDLTQAEGLADLLAAETELQRRSAIARSEGAVRRRIEGWADRIVALSAGAEYAIDYDEDDRAPPIDRLEMEAIRGEIANLLAQPRLERLRDGIRVVLAGPPNIGKSSLFNTLIGESRAIVTPVEGTTRDTIEAPVAIDGIPFVLVDTAGLRDSDDPVEALGIERTRSEVDRADIVLWLDREPPPPLAAKVVKVSAQADRLPLLPGRIGVSATTGEGVTVLLERLIDVGRPLLPAASQATIDERGGALLAQAASRLAEAQSTSDLILIAEHLRSAREALMAITGRVGIEAMLDSLMQRFCVGK
ncbi:tRNA uridine-5-carboxymethylaminomethyl(34) synthesis GTPase MnmE [Sphingomonas sp. ASV193]|uniref:tRNA uridine-5-carboxymethylaminomethyl(34) synthesis GTPase MnmE n=1 Tax=Sphingomonas sp. ASV193 TaxID=3144405 RepID=UPI0032E937E7